MFSRFYHVIFRNLHHIYMIPQMEYVSRHPEKYSEEQMYALDRLCIRRMIKPGRITTEGYGIHNLPDEGGYIMCPNHQGKYDALGIMLTHDKPCSVVMDIEKSNTPLVRQFINLVHGKRMAATITTATPPPSSNRALSRAQCGQRFRSSLSC